MDSNRRFNVKIRPFIGIIAIILVSLFALCSCDTETTPSSDSGIITGYVKLEDGIPASDVMITLTGYDLDYVSYAVNPDEDGYFRIEDVYPYTYTVEYSCKYYLKVTKENISVNAGKTVNMPTVTLAVQYGFLAGKVTDDVGTPLSGATVTVSGNGMSYSAKSGTDGTYTISAKPGKYTDISFAYPDHNLKDSKITNVKAGSTVTIPDYGLPFNHNYLLIDMQESTKTAAGYRKYQCSDCKDEYTVPIPARTDGARWAGVRASSYGMSESFGSYPGVATMASIGEAMESCYAGSNGTFVLIVGVVDEYAWSCHLDFPLSKKIDNAFGNSYDLYENYLTALDNAGYSVWLQVEPGNADLVELATEVMTHYGHHSCVKGFGIDVEWYKLEGGFHCGIDAVVGLQSDYHQALVTLLFHVVPEIPVSEAAVDLLHEDLFAFSAAHLADKLEVLIPYGKTAALAGIVLDEDYLHVVLSGSIYQPDGSGHEVLIIVEILINYSLLHIYNQ